MRQGKAKSFARDEVDQLRESQMSSLVRPKMKDHRGVPASREHGQHIPFLS